MQEIIALHQKIAALPEETRPPHGVNFSRAEEDSEHVELLPADLQAELASVRAVINAALPEDFDYFAFLGEVDADPVFDLLHDGQPAASSEDGHFLPERSLVEQLRELDWDEQRARAAESGEAMQGMLDLTRRASDPLPSVKGLQREFREETKEFVKEKRGDADRLHFLYYDGKADKLLEAAFTDGDALRDALPGMIARGLDAVALVAWGKPLPVERVDALMAQAQQTFRERLETSFEEAEAGETPVESIPEAVEPPSAGLEEAC